LVSIDLKVDFLAPVLDKTVIAIGKRVKAGKTIYLTEAQLSNQNGKV
jgi:acyl-coenzyme A thioesterase PaaI-like protein